MFTTKDLSEKAAIKVHKVIVGTKVGTKNNKVVIETENNIRFTVKRTSLI